MNAHAWIPLLALALSTAPVAHAEPEHTPDVATIVNKANIAAYYKGRSGRARVAMSIVDAQGRERTRELTILRLDLEPEDDDSDTFMGDQMFYVYFERPADVNRTAYLVHKHIDKDDDRWLFLPGLNLVRRIAASDERTSFVGSDFYYEDISGRGVAKDTHALIETTDAFYVVKSTPNDPRSVEFDHFKSWIHKDTFIPIKTEYYDATGNAIRQMTAIEVQHIQGYPTTTKAVMKDLRSGSTTTLTYSRVDYNIDIDESIFTERYLRNPPRRLLR